VTPPAINVMPMPATMTLGAGRLLVPQTFSVAIAGYNEPRLERAEQRFLRDLGRQTGYFLSDRHYKPNSDGDVFDSLWVLLDKGQHAFRYNDGPDRSYGASYLAALAAGSVRLNCGLGAS
jgi:hypothetical protein